MEPKILVVEDDLTLIETLEYNLARQGYEVLTAADGWLALDVARQERPDLIVLDIMLPGLDGLEVCRILRREMNVPILMLTARVGEVDKIVGLEMGADDYLTKPFNMRELLARVKAQLRRVPTPMADVILPPVDRLLPQAERAGLSLSVDLPSDLPPMLADAERVRQVVTNLLHNAVKFTPPGGQVTLSAEHVGDEVVISVRDTRVGIPADDLLRIFERFYKADRARRAAWVRSRALSF